MAVEGENKPKIEEITIEEILIDEGSSPPTDPISPEEISDTKSKTIDDETMAVEEEEKKPEVEEMTIEEITIEDASPPPSVPESPVEVPEPKKETVDEPMAVEEEKKPKIEEITIEDATPAPAVPISPVEIPDEITGFPAFFHDVIDIGITFAINGKKQDVDIDEQSSILDCPSQVVSLVMKRMNKFPKKLDKEKVSDAPPAKPSAGNQQKNMLTIPDYYTSAAGKFLMGIGLSRVKQHYHRDIISKLKKQIRKEGEAEDLVEELKKQQEYYSLVRGANAAYQSAMEKCEQCDFKTEFNSVMSHHMLYPHMTPRKEFKCNHCQFSHRDPKVISTHVDSLHQLPCNIEPLPQLYECPICPWETGLKSKATGHITRCLKTYLPDKLLAIKDDVVFYPAITPKPITREDIKIYEATLQALRYNNQNKFPQSNNNQGSRSILKKPQRQQQQQPMNPANILNRLAPNLPQQSSQPSAQLPPQAVPNAPPTNPSAMVNNLLANMNIKSMTPQLLQIMTQNPQLISVAAKFMSNPQQSSLLNRGQAAGGSQQNLLQHLQGLNLPGNNGRGQGMNTSQTSKKPRNSVLSSMSGQVPANAHALPDAGELGGNHNQQQRQIPPTGKDGQLIMCEICDGYIDNVEQLRTHMHWIHKVKIHPKMLQNRPPLNCQKCQWRFFTDQGLERHLLGSHGLVTTNMQELVGENKDGGRCTLCRRVYTSKLVSHMNLYHKMNLKPAHLSYKCTVCSATFNLYRLFESHVYVVHSGNGSSKRNSDAPGNASGDHNGSSDLPRPRKVPRMENGN